MLKIKSPYIILFFIALVILTGLLLSCGGGGGGGSDSAPTQSGTQLPPDPGAAGKQTLAGIDSDNDGVRDDVQRYIMLTYSDTPTRQALVQFTTAEQSTILSAGDEQQVLNHAYDVDRAIECLAYNRPNDFSHIIDNMLSVILNTRERIEASAAADARLSGKVFPSTDIQDGANSCR